MAEQLQRIRIFIASSAELADHRADFETAVRRANDHWQQRGLYLEPVLWENFLDAMDATRLQNTYNEAIGGSDLFVMLYRTKVGRYTAEEFQKAFQHFKETGKPRIYTYFHNASVDIGDLAEEDFLSLKGFQKKLKELGHFQTEYKNVAELRDHFKGQLEKLFDKGHLVPKHPGPEPRPVPGSLVPYLTRRAAHWRERSAGKLDRDFVNLILMIDRRLDDGQQPREVGRYELLSDLLAAHADVKAWVLVGLPGSGKSTVLQHHEMTMADAALQALAQPTPQPALPEICIWHRLSEYDAEKSPAPQDWLAAPGRWPEDLPPLAQLGQQARVRFLLDGLNEIKAPNRAQQLQAVQRWSDWAAATAARPGGLAPVFSVRTLDQSPMGSADVEVRQVTLGAWSSKQIKAYCSRKLGEDNGLWPAIEGEPALLQLSELPFNLWAQCELYSTLGRATRTRAELMGGLFWQMLSRRANDAALQAPGLLGDDDRQRCASGRWKGTLRVLPDRQGCLVPWLDDALQRLHERGRAVSVTQTELLAGLPPRAGAATPEQWLYAVRSLQLLDEEGRDEFTGEPLLRCLHQLWQEFFAGRAIRDWPATQAARWQAWLPTAQAPDLPPLQATLQRLTVQEALPPPDPTHWEEPVKLAVQLVREPNGWIRGLQPHNLALAGRAAVAVRERLDEATLDTLRQALLQRSRDAGVDLRLRIEAGLALGELGDPRYEERSGPHGRYRWPRQWVTVPAGPYRIGDNAAPYEDEKPETELDLQAFAMAFAPVTNAEYRCFIEAGGYKDERWWEGELALQWLKEGVRNEAEIERIGELFREARDDVDSLLAANPQLPEAQVHWWRERAAETEEDHAEMLDQWYGARRYELPQEWHNPAFNAPSQPVVGICQYEARAYACWLAAQSGQAVRLPTEAEWEAAARGAARRLWPWGDQPPQAWQLNHDPAHLRRTSPVGCFPAADTPDGLVDMAGNVLEWTTSPFTEDGLKAEALMQQPADDLARRVVRGGSWFYSTVACRPSCRLRLSPVNRDYYLGFRVVLSCPIQNPEP